MSCNGESLICCLVWHVLIKSPTANLFESVCFILSPRPSVTRAAVLTPIVEYSPKSIRLSYHGNAELSFSDAKRKQEIVGFYLQYGLVDGSPWITSLCVRCSIDDQIYQQRYIFTRDISSLIWTPTTISKITVHCSHWTDHCLVSVVVIILRLNFSLGKEHFCTVTLIMLSHVFTVVKLMYSNM